METSNGVAKQECSTSTNIILTIITLIHVVVIILILTVPFVNDNHLLFMYLIIIPFIVLHWVANNNTCCLTVTERWLRGISSDKPVPMEECLSYKLIAPIYDFKKNNEDYSTFIYGLVAVLWGIAGFRIYKKWDNGEIASFKELMFPRRKNIII
jgi:hypothetical protein